MAKSETKSRKLSAYATATVCFKCTAGPSIIFIDRIWALIKKGCRALVHWIGLNMVGGQRELIGQIKSRKKG